MTIFLMLININCYEINEQITFQLQRKKVKAKKLPKNTEIKVREK